MPLFRYECKTCGDEFRVLHQRGDHSPVTCPSCDGTDIRRLPSRVSVQFKGSGYYKTDRANKKSKVGTKGFSDKETSETSLDGNSGDSKSKSSEQTGYSDANKGDSNSSIDSASVKKSRSAKSDE